MGFAKASKRQARVKLALVGPSGAGKTYSSLLLAKGLGQRIAVLDTERGSASLYADSVAEFDVLEMEPPYDLAKYIAAIGDAERAGYDVLVIDSLSHAWAGAGGALEKADQASSGPGGKFSAWKHVTPLQNKLVDAITGAKMHVICTLRTKTEWVIEENNGKKQPRKVGLAPVQRDGIEHEFSVVFDLSREHVASASKDRTGLFDSFVGTLSAEHGQAIAEWATIGAPAKPADPAKEITKQVLTTFQPTKQDCWDRCKELGVPADEFKAICEGAGIVAKDESTHTPERWSSVWAELCKKEANT